ncbi:hypothetical protein A2380_03020 [candidate division WWE3 bacterium RIFOXYB1_FULL_43_24]|uniref:Carboxypeptidase regulatory-like domain-containing protein n=1 Tax=candidate division WWE3 bacterium GW2011_GWF1_42_14 TaxID=1619138 RepID=A0A0G1AU04_UNCKA|nr:MAG: hypothetical protein UU92_C0007G0013 [candidate division WWE3 bacterium GW2011_GWA1_42_12]KKS37576.1 MAG: hypothetical protein UV00_C0013G0007 [candidate division WWE3 bacterium GW2011_GWF1_42_14]OGC58728.1 MAG: hypothetical protein A2212_00595 [candidate division WWE3 bacterium RIFOXYA1_FULL_42_9]OGC69067.1 MAG: hypothetical protein A2380_03020 [candidate division WWE3 bacterium RIFOXYB1_FULL_43_24]OGC72243.1 MAG: hypothetical protein A2414_01655 [candidate division WWE3 bacterium RIFO
MALADMPQSNKQHAVPQNVMSVDFKLIGDLTMRQFAYVFIAGILAYLSYVFFIGIFRWPLVFFIAFMGIGFAFIPVQERGMDEWIVNFFRAMNMPTQRVWKKEPTIPSAFMYDDLATLKQELITLAPTSSRRKLEEYLKYQTSPEEVDPLDIPEKEYAKKVKDAFPAYKKKSSTGATAFSRSSYGAQPVGVQPAVAPVAGAPVSTAVGLEPPKEEGILVETPQVGAVPVEKLESKDQGVIQKRKDAGLFHIFRAKEAQKAREEAIAKKTSGSIPAPAPQGASSGSVSLSPMTPDMHSGRRFINLLPSQGELILPIRGERVLRTSEEISVEESINDKALKLQSLLKKIKEEEGIKLSKPRVIPVPVVQKKEQEAQEVHDEAKDVVEKLKTQSGELTDEITRLKKNIQTTHTPGTASETQSRLLKDLETKQQTVEENYKVLSRGIQSLKSPPSGDTSGPSRLNIDSYPLGSVTPNTLHGVVKNAEGKVLTDVLLIVKNEREEPVRALKTDSLGRFELLSALGNGKYSIEVKPSDEIKLSFEKISVELKGEVVPPFVISGK